MIASIHIADIGAKSALKVWRKTPAPFSIDGLREANVALAAPLAHKPPKPDFGRAAFVALWDDDDAIDQFLADHPLADALSSGWHVRLEPLRAYGSWPGLPSDVPSSRSVDHDGPVAVLTLGRLRLSQTVRFIRTSAKAEAAVIGAPGLVWATGLAKPPFVSTCSLWESGQAAATYAFGRKEPAHPDAIEADKAKPFHHQEAFIRFRPYGSTGALDGQNPLSRDWLSA